MRRSVASVVVVLSLVAATFLLTASPSAQSDTAIEASRSHFNANRAEYGLSDPASELRVRRSRADAQGVSHVRFDQYYRGLPVFEGEAIVHADGAGNVTVTNGLHGNLNLDATPRVKRNAAINTTVRSISPLGNYEVSGASLVILPRGERSITDRVAWRVAVKVENEFEDPAEWQVLRRRAQRRRGLLVQRTGNRRRDWNGEHDVLGFAGHPCRHDRGHHVLPARPDAERR